jgi:hypothetical protein
LNKYYRFLSILKSLSKNTSVRWNKCYVGHQPNLKKVNTNPDRVPNDEKITHSILLFIHTFSWHKNVQEYERIILSFIMFNIIHYVWLSR